MNWDQSTWSLRHIEMCLQSWRWVYRFISTLETMISFSVTLALYVSRDALDVPFDIKSQVTNLHFEWPYWLRLKYAGTSHSEYDMEWEARFPSSTEKTVPGRWEDHGQLGLRGGFVPLSSFHRFLGEGWITEDWLSNRIYIRINLFSSAGFYTTISFGPGDAVLYDQPATAFVFD